jgi:hypothetical protein
MQGILYEESSFWLFALVTVIMGGGAAYMTGRACAITWRPIGTLVFFLCILGIAVRFIHHAIFDGTFFSLHYYIADTLTVLAIGLLGFRYVRARQMSGQYYWLYEQAGPFSWRPRAGGDGA